MKNFQGSIYLRELRELPPVVESTSLFVGQFLGESDSERKRHYLNLPHVAESTSG